MKSVRQTQSGKTEAYVEVRGGGRWEGRRLHLAWTQKGCSKLCKMEKSNWRPTLHLGVKLQWEKRGFSLIFPSCIDGLRTECIVKSPEASWFWAILIKLTTESTTSFYDTTTVVADNRLSLLTFPAFCHIFFRFVWITSVCLLSSPFLFPFPHPPPQKSWASLATAVGCLRVPYSIIKIDFLRRDLAAANRKILYTATRYRSETVGRRNSRIKSTSLFSRYKLAQENSLLLNSNHEC